MNPLAEVQHADPAQYGQHLLGLLFSIIGGFRPTVQDQ